MNNSELNELLADAKKAQQYWDSWKNEETFDGSPLVEILSKGVKAYWISLHKAIREAVPCIVSLENGETRQVGTVGLMDDLWLYYSENLKDGKNTIQDVYLEEVTSIEKVEEVLNY